MPNGTRLPADCHPDKPRKTADGRCDACYVRDRYQNDPAVRQRQLERAAKQRAKRYVPRDPEVCNDCGKTYTPRTRLKRNPTCYECRERNGNRPMLGTRRCAWCYSEFKYYEQRIRYCTNECAKHSYSEGTSEPIRWKQCEHCQEWRTHKVKHYCPPPPPPPPECATCGKPVTEGRYYRYCSDYCGEVAYGRDRCDVHFIDCYWCGTLFTARQPNARYCSEACRKNVDKSRPKIRKSLRQAVYERDKWKCQICGKRVGKTYKSPHPRSASLDHIIPRSLGGPDTAENLNLVHLACNVAKHTAAANGGEQLRLVG